jgi:hypothetical protein
MFYVRVYKKFSEEVVEERTFSTIYDLENYISRVSSIDIKYNDYRIAKTEKVLEFFKKTYYANFYVEFDRYIELCVLNKSQKRLKNNKKKTNSNKILENTLLRIQTGLNKELKKTNLKPIVIMPRLSKERYEKIKIFIREKNYEHFFLIDFDKIFWEFRVVTIQTTQPKLIKILTDVFRYTTTPTRIYREKNKVIQNEDNT